MCKHVCLPVCSLDRWREGHGLSLLILRHSRCFHFADAATIATGIADVGDNNDGGVATRRYPADRSSQRRTSNKRMKGRIDGQLKGRLSTRRRIKETKQEENRCQRGRSIVAFIVVVPAAAAPKA